MSLAGHLRHPRGLLADARQALRDAPRWIEIARSRPAPADEPRVFYGYDRLASLGERSHGGIVKFQRLALTYPNEPRRFNLVYMGSSSRPADSRALIALARRRRAPLVWNQNGVAYLGWAGEGWERVNRTLAPAYLEADHVFHQSEFCQVSAERYLGRRQGPSEVLYNPVDTEVFFPAETRPERPLTLLLAGSQYQRYRLVAALDTAAELVRRGVEVRLLITGAMSWSGDPDAGRREALELISARGLEQAVELVGPYSQAEAPEIMRRADLLLHTKYNDPCPGVVLEAMAAGLPVVYSASGGVPELVGPDAGVGVPAPLDWERDHAPAPAELADAVEEASGRIGELAGAARARAVERFELRDWVARHTEVFKSLLGAR